MDDFNSSVQWFDSIKYTQRRDKQNALIGMTGFAKLVRIALQQAVDMVRGLRDAGARGEIKPQFR